MTVKYELPNFNFNAELNSEVETPLQKYIAEQLLALLTQKENLHGRRIGKAKDAIKPQDYITKRQVTFNLVGTLAKRPGANLYPDGTTYYATDRNVTYIDINDHWYYYSGTQNVTLNPNTKPSPSVLYDVGYRIYATDFDWYFHWSGVAWVREGGANQYIQGFKVAPTQPGWALCDGSTVTGSTDTGGTQSIVTPTLNGGTKFLKFDGTYSASVTAVAPTASGSGGSLSGHAYIPNHAHPLTTVTDAFTSGGESVTHQHNIGLSVNFSGTTVIFVNNASLVGGTNQVVQANSGTVSGNSDDDDSDHLHDTTVDFSGKSTDDSSGEEIDLSGVSVSLSSITINADGKPAAVALLPYIRL